ncbi:MAG: decarboxylase [Candidatus Woesearchaeota archaeon]
MKNKATFLLSKSTAIKKHNEVKKISNIVSYSFKTNIDIGLILKENTDCMFSIHSFNELKLINANDRIIFFAQAWSSNEIDYLIKNNVKNFVVDNMNDLNLIIDYIKKTKINNINLLLRMRVKEKTIHTGKFFVYGFYSRQINELIPKLANEKIFSKIGIHFHRKTQNVSEWSIEQELNEVLTKEVFSDIDIINIGGGIPSIYKNYNYDVTENIVKKIENTKILANKNNIKLIIEPGRFIAAPAIKLETKILSIYDNNIIVGCSVYNAAMDTFVANVRLIVEGELDENEGKPYTIKGITPDSIDIFRYRVFLKNPKVNDKIIFLNAGAYNYWTNFCGLEKIPIKIVK